MVEASHDGYVRRFGLIHQRQLTLAADGRELRGQDLLTLQGRRRRAEPIPYAVRFHLHPDVEAATTADGQGALLRVRGRTVWQFRCRGGRLAIEDSLWIDGEARLRETSQLVVGGESPAGRHRHRLDLPPGGLGGIFAGQSEDRPGFALGVGQDRPGRAGARPWRGTASS